jgi:segregation and condensation protein A
MAAFSVTGSREPDRPPTEEGIYIVEIERFHGPLDLLLHLIRQQDIDVFDIPIALITRQFLRAIEGIGPGELDQAGEFLEMAATLIRIKAQLLLPRSDADEDEDPRAELVRRLLEYEQIREISQRLERAEADRSRRRSRGYVPPRPRAFPEDTPLETTWEEVYEAALEVRLPEARAGEHRVTPRTVSMDSRVALILHRLARGAGLPFSSLMGPGEDRMHGVMTLLAGLELSRRRAIVLRQAAPFHELWLYRRDGEGEGDDPDPDPPEEPGAASASSTASPAADTDTDTDPIPDAAVNP